VQKESGWREMAFGCWEGLTVAEIQQHYAEALVAWQTDPVQVAPPGGETLAQVTDRIRAVLARLVHASQEHTAILAAHGGPLRVLLCLALGLPPRAHWRFMLVPGSLSELYIHTQGAVLMRLNETHHLSEVDHMASQIEARRDIPRLEATIWGN
jgi:broad specificity phosphatase PhoE